MKRGKKICGELKKIRRRIADENGIKLDIPECTFEGECRGTCPRCEWEVKYLEQSLFERLKLGKIATISGLALGLTACGGGGIGPDIQVVGDVPNQDTENVVSETIIPPPPEPEWPDDIPVVGFVEDEEDIPANALKQEKDTLEEDLVEGEMPMYYKEPENEIFISTDGMPEFPGGEQALYDFLAKNIRIPSEPDVIGKVFVSFVVEKDGTITNPKVLRDIGAGCGEEALRVVRMMPKWKPGMHKGKAVRVQYTMPVVFKLEK